MARCAAFERSKFDQVLKITSISPKRLAYTILSFPLSFCLDFSLVLGFVVLCTLRFYAPLSRSDVL